MFEHNCKFGGEMSGHIFFADDYYGYDDAIYVAARLLQTLSSSKKHCLSLQQSYQNTSQLLKYGWRQTLMKKSFKISKKAVEYFSSNFDCITIDGVRINFDDGWGLVRASNTQPVIVCRFEAKTQERMEEIKDMVTTKLNEMGELKSDVVH